MKSNRADIERSEFVQRLMASLVASGHDISPTALAKEFNIRAREKRVTAHGVRKWLFGESIPNQFRLTILASIMNVSPAWLRFGDAVRVDYPPLAKIPFDILQMLEDVWRLDSPSLRLVEVLVTGMLDNQDREAELLKLNAVEGA